MGFTRFDGVERLHGSSMPFENYLKQINLLFPNKQDLYFYYLNMIHDFYFNQYDRLKPYNAHIPYRDFIIDKGLVEIESMKESDIQAYAAYLMLFHNMIFNALHEQSLDAASYKTLHDATVIDTLASTSNLFDTLPNMYLPYFTLIHQWYFEEYERLREIDEHADFRDVIISTGLFEILDFKNTDTNLYTNYMHEFISYIVAELSDTESTLDYQQQTLSLFYHAVRDVLSATDALFGKQDHQYMFYNIAGALSHMISLYDDNISRQMFGGYILNSMYLPLLQYDEMNEQPPSSNNQSRWLFNWMAEQVFGQLLSDVTIDNHFPTTCVRMLSSTRNNKGSYWYLTQGDQVHVAADSIRQVVHGIFSDLSGSMYTTASAPIIQEIADWIPWLYNVHPGLFQVLEDAMKNAKGDK